MKTLDQHIAENAAHGDPTCFVCEADYSIREDQEDTGVCDQCAQAMVRDGLRYRKLRAAQIRVNNTAKGDVADVEDWEMAIGIALDEKDFDTAVDGLAATTARSVAE